MLVDRLRQIEAIIEDHGRRISNIVREGKVVETFPDEGLVRVEIDGMRSNKIPWATRAGKIRVWQPPAKDERVLLLSPTGETSQGLVIPGGYSDQNPENHDKDDEVVLTIGDIKIHVKDAEIVIDAAGTKWTLNQEGFVQNGGKIEHDGHLVDKSHVHTNVVPGGGLSGPPP